MKEKMNKMAAKTSQQELIKTMGKKRGIKQKLMTDNTAMKMEIQKITLEIQREQSKQKERKKERN